MSQYNETYSFSTWLYKIADNIAYRHFKNTKFISDIDDVEEFIPDSKPTAEELVDKKLDQEAVREAVDNLPSAYKQVVTLYYWDGFSYEEIAKIIDRPVGTIRTWLHRAKEHLRKELYGQI